MNREPRWAIVRGVPKSPIGLSDSTCTHGLYGLRRCTSAVERSYPLSEVRGSSPDFQAATAQERQAERSYPTSEVRGSGREELPRIRGQGWRPRVPGCDSAGAAERSYTRPRPGEMAGRSYPRPEARGGGREELPYTRGQGQRPRGAIPHPRSGGCAGPGGPKEASPHSRSRVAAVRRYPTSKVRSSGCALLEQP